MKGINLMFVVVSKCGIEFNARWYDVKEAYTGNKKYTNFFLILCLVWNVLSI
jgi:hypothetical protein